MQGPWNNVDHHADVGGWVRVRVAEVHADRLVVGRLQPGDVEPHALRFGVAKHLGDPVRKDENRSWRADAVGRGIFCGGENGLER